MPRARSNYSPLLAWLVSIVLPLAGVAQESDKAEALVKQLGSRQFTEREAAQKQLRSTGLEALPALQAGLKSTDTEVARGAQTVIGLIHQDCEPRIWKRWSQLIGDDTGSRELFHEMWLAQDAVVTLARFTDSPDSIEKGYPAAMQRLRKSAASRTLINPMQRVNMLSCYSMGEAILGVYLGTYPESKTIRAVPSTSGENVDPEMEMIETALRLLWVTRGDWDADAASRGRYQQGNKILLEPARKLCAVSLLNLKNPQTIERFFRSTDSMRSVTADTAIALPLARMAAREKSFPLKTRVASWPYLAEAGATEYLPDMKEWQNDKTRIQQFWRSDENNREYNVLVSDISIACQLLLHQQKLKDFGFFEHLNEGKTGIDKSCCAFGFPNEKSRQEAYAKASAYLKMAK